MVEKADDWIDVPVYVYLWEGAVNTPMLLMVFFNGLSDAIDALVNWLAEASGSYLNGLVATVIDDWDSAKGNYSEVEIKSMVTD